VISGEMSLNVAYKEVGAPKKKKASPPPPPPIDIKTLPGSAQEKLEVAIRQEIRRLQTWVRLLSSQPAPLKR
jgi:hypothetical protein